MSENGEKREAMPGGGLLPLPEKMKVFSKSGGNVADMQDDLLEEADGLELFFQESEVEDGDRTVYGYPREDVLDLIYELAYPVVKLIDDRADIRVKSNRSVTDFFVIVRTRKGGAFIGKHGKTLDAAETVVAHSVSLRFPQWVNVEVDVDNYRRKRRQILETQIKRVVRDVERDHRERPMDELLPKERKIVHQFFSEHPYLTTESRGQGRERTLYILPRKDIKEI